MQNKSFKGKTPFLNIKTLAKEKNIPFYNGWAIPVLDACSHALIKPK